jgi:hypothetical protein
MSVTVRGRMIRTFVLFRKEATLTRRRYNIRSVQSEFGALALEPPHFVETRLLQHYTPFDMDTSWRELLDLQQHSR